VDLVPDNPSLTSRKLPENMDVEIPACIDLLSHDR